MNFREHISLLKKSTLSRIGPQIGLQKPQKRRVWCPIWGENRYQGSSSTAWPLLGTWANKPPADVRSPPGGIMYSVQDPSGKAGRGKEDTTYVGSDEQDDGHGATRRLRR